MDEPPQGAVPAATSRDKRSRSRKLSPMEDVSRIGQRRVDRGLDMYSDVQEQVMGKQMAEDFESQCRILHDPVVNRYINDLGQRLARNSDARIPFIIKVVDSDEINAFALPGGYFYVNSGLILAAENEAELAAVMAHEIAHVAARHGTRNMTKIQLWNIASIPMVFLGGPIGMALREVSSVAFPMSVTKFSRDAEREADLLGLEYQYAAGYDPVAFVNFFERVSAHEGKKGFLAKAFATHPMNSDRIRRAQEEIDSMLPPRDDYIVDTSEFEEAQARLLDVMNLKPVLHRGAPVKEGPVLHRRTRPEPPTREPSPASKD